MDVMAISIVNFLALLIRYDMYITDIPRKYIDAVGNIWVANLVISLAMFWIWRLYKSVWRYASATELLNIFGAVCVIFGIQLIYFKIFEVDLPRSYPFFYMFLLFIFTTGIRFSYRILRIFNQKRRGMSNGVERKHCMVVGAGAAGYSIIKEIESSSYLSMKICCVIDDNPGCWEKRLRGFPIVGGRDSIPAAVEKYEIDEIIIAIPSAKPSQLKGIIEICKETGCRIRTLPAIYQLINGEVNVSKLREVEIEDLLGREPVKVNLDEIMGYVSGKTIMVTGGGGSIGGELARQIATHNPKCLILVDIYENNAYDIQQELKEKYPDLNLKVLIASVRNTGRMDAIFEKYRPQIVYHAAAHKHVPLMEDSPNEAIKNNVFGTYKTAIAADKYGVEKFVMISTDKAVNPTNIMGASKRICEMIVQSMNRKSKTEFVAVRFGNVLGSNGSVIPLFKRQIAQGGPVTVTHPDIIRYFMTIPEAVSLVLQAGAYAKGGEIFVLDMGEPVRILDLAKNLIKLSGYKVDEDIEIVFTGLRPGEKMYEELLMNEEGLRETDNQMIHIGKPIVFDEEEFEQTLMRLKEVAESEDEDVRSIVQELVPTYHPL
ncbi:MAG: polysaccharide biosynthesis protein [Lachnospiraceae bacterium]|nr:polysaccharide biosynthesis protein [Lachnospiraceae bacterium]